MNSQPNILELPTAESIPADVTPDTENGPITEHPLSGDPQSKIEIQNSKIDPPHPAFGTGNRGRGFVARLPKAVRDQLNNMILDGVPYPEIIQRLGEPTKHLKPDHVHQWKKHGYQDWLLERE